ncbi:MAG: MxaK protein [Burkholderiales bacterium]|nr:MxaK protein [Burkholderiales bacterium]
MVLSRSRRVALVLLALVALVAAFDGWRWLRAAQINRIIDTARVPTEAEASAHPELRYAQAWALAASGASDAALNRYGSLQADARLGAAARYNTANLLMAQALRLREEGHAEQAGQALALVELAKENYRELLRADPGNWNARYNLERAQRIAPEADADDAMPPDLQRGAEHSATSMRGMTLGQP